MAQVKKLIEVALPLEKINAEAAREKSIRHGHPSTLHLWWARRPLAAARAVIWASLVDDPSSHPEEFPTEEAQAAERERLFRILEQLVVWENSNNEQVLAAAKAEIMKSTNGNPPELLDPFAGGGAIPLEAQRLGLKAHAHDLNPVAVMINKAMIEIPPRFAGMPPVNPEARAKFGADTKWKGAAGLAEDVRYYGEWMKQEAFKKIGYLYPKVQVPLEQGGGEATVIDYIWARTVKCPNPACGCEIPLIKSFYISQRKNKEVWLKPTINSKKITLEIKHGNRNVPEGTVDQKIQGAKCLCCNSHVDFEYLRNCASKGEMGLRLIAVALDINKQKTYISGDDIPDTIYNICPPAMHPSIELPNKALGFRIQQYGMKDYSDLFTPRQLNMLTCFSDLVKDVKQKIQDDMCLVETTDLLPSEYSIAIITYLAFVVDRMANYGSSLCLWDSRGGTVVQTFGRQALSFIWNFAEPNPFSNTNVAGEWTNTVEVVARALSGLPYNSIIQGSANQHNAMEKISIKNLMISTDPPYYDNIGYADLSNFFYLWMRNSLHDYYQPLFNTIQVPKNEELIANPFRFETKEEAKRFFEKGMQEAFSTFHGYAIDDIPVTVYYAFKQSETEKDETSSTGWETMLSAIINSGFSITGTWPMATENPGGLRVNNRNALSSSIILVCRKRPIDSSSTTRRNFIAELKRELRPALQKLQASSIAPVDLAQSAIGPGMGVFSK